MIVMKFGGSSVECAAAVERVASIVAARLAEQPAVVVSAMGKTTNKLLEMAAVAVRGERERALALLKEREAFHRQQAEALAASGERDALVGEVTRHFQELRELLGGLAVLGELTPRSVDAVSSYGERLSSLIVAAAFRRFGLPAVHVDAREVIVTDRRHTQAQPLYDATYARLAAVVKPLLCDKVVVMGGFIGATPEGVTTTLGRGGSDFSASLVGVGIQAKEIQIWTDVDGMMTCDPRIVPEARRLKTISFNEAAELAYFGAKVLHPSTVLPAIEHDIPVLVLNSRRPEVDGTRIVAQPVVCANVVKAISLKKDITVVDIRSLRMLMAHGFLKRIFEVFDRYETSVDMVTTSEVSVSLTIDQATHLEAITAALTEFSQVSVEREQAIICVVGDRIRETPGVAGKVFSALGEINVRMISQGASLRNIGFVVAGADAEEAARRLHEEFFRQVDPNVFD